MNGWVQLIGMIVWPVFFAVLLFCYKNTINKLFKTLFDRIERGSPLKTPFFELGEQTVNVTPNIDDKTNSDTEAGLSEVEDWVKERTNLYKQNRGVFLTHVIKPSEYPDFKYDVFVYLLGHIPNNKEDKNGMDEIEYAEFFFGHKWGNQIFKVDKRSSPKIGINTKAYGPFLCVCRVTFNDGQKIILNRYIDFEMGVIYEGSH